MGKKLFAIILSEGIFFTLLGALILLIPQTISMWSVLFLSIVLILGGMYKTINSIVLRKELETPWILAVTGFLCILGGIYIKLNPYFSLVIFTIIIAVYLILDGIYSITTALAAKDFSKIWGAGLLSGLLQILLAALIIYWLPSVSLITLGVLIGANMLAGGIGLILLSSGFSKTVNPN